MESNKFNNVLDERKLNDSLGYYIPINGLVTGWSTYLSLDKIV